MKKTMNLVSAILLLTLIIMSPASVIAQTQIQVSQSSSLMNQSVLQTAEAPTLVTETSKQVAHAGESADKNTGFSQTLKTTVSGGEEKIEESSKQENKVNDTTTMLSDSSQVKEDAVSRKTDNVVEKSETKSTISSAAQEEKIMPKNVNESKEIDAITDLKITDRDGNPLKKPLKQWEQFRIDGRFVLPNNEVQEGDHTTIKVPDVLLLQQLPAFDIKDKNGQVVAHVVIDAVKKQLH